MSFLAGASRSAWRRCCCGSQRRRRLRLRLRRWAEAGVDLIVEDVPRDWLAPPAPLTAPLADSARTAASGVSETPPADTLPDTLDAFMGWRASDAAPETSWRGAFVMGGGPADAKIAVIVDCPDADDADAGQLLSGAAGRLFDRMLAAIGLTRAEIFLAAVCAKRPLAGRMPREIEARLGDIVRHHLGLATPKHVLCLGNAASRAILGTEMPANRGHLHAFNHRSGDIGVVTSFHPRLLLEKPALKAEAWRDLQLLMGDLT